MARTRYLKPDFFKDEDLAEHPYWIRIMYAGLWGIADKEGRLEDRIKRIKVEVFPYDKVDIEKGLQVLASCKTTGRPFIQRYEVNGERYIQILKWHEHQKPHHTEKESEIPPAPPLKINIKEKGSVHEGSRRLDNRDITVKEPLKKFLDFVFLSKEEHEKLVERYGISVTATYIKNLNYGIGSKGYKYKSHYFAILAWLNKDGVKVLPKKQETEQRKPDPKEQKKVAKLVHKMVEGMGKK